MPARLKCKKCGYLATSFLIGDKGNEEKAINEVTNILSKHIMASHKDVVERIGALSGQILTKMSWYLAVTYCADIPTDEKALIEMKDRVQNEILTLMGLEVADPEGDTV